MRAIAILSPSLLALAGLAAAEPTVAPPIVVTASQRAEAATELTATVRVVEPDPDLAANHQSLTDLLARHALGFLSEWTPAQTSVNIRGAASDGQGRDFRSQVLTLVNGRRAGTANLSKLGTAGLARVEIIRGPASVMHGSQAMGGVVNLITVDPAEAAGGRVGVQTGSWGRFGSEAAYGFAANGVDAFVGVNYLRRGDHDGGDGAGTQVNSDVERLGGTAALGFDPADGQRLLVVLRSDGTLDAGFRGSSYSIYNREDRRNSSLEAIWTGEAGERLAWRVQPYLVRDEDDFRWGNRAATPAISLDHNRRTLDIVGSRQHLDLAVSSSNDLLVGVDAERARLRSTRHRERLDGLPATQLAPFDANADSTTVGVYAEDHQRLFEGRLGLRAGFRYTLGWEAIVETPNIPLLSPRTERYEAVTWSAGATWRAVDPLTLRVGAATGFRAPTASDLALDFTSIAGNQTFGNPELDPESNLLVEVGATLDLDHAWFDVAVFRNTIRDRMITRPLNPPAAQPRIWDNSPDDAVIEGGELASVIDIAALAGWTGWRVELGAEAIWHWRIEDTGAPGTRPNDDKIQRVYEHQGAGRLTIGQPAAWDVGLAAVWRGTMFYDTEERLLIPQGEPAVNHIHRKPGFWTFDLTARWHPSHALTLWGAVNNLLDENNHPIYIAIDEQPYISNPATSNGARGNSMPGREFVVGGAWRF